ncbi:MAG: DUF502 domain-containing protein [Vicinamibacterales bacterium]
MLQWVRRSFIAGFFVTVPLFITVSALIWLFGIVDGLTDSFYQRQLGRQVPGLGILTTAVGLLLVGTIATNVIGKRLLQRLDGYLLKVPVFGTIYAPVKQLVVAFSPDNESGFKRVVLVRQADRYALGFLTKEFTTESVQGRAEMVAVYVPTNHLYLGDIIICERDAVSFPSITVEEGLRIFLTGGMALPTTVRNAEAEASAPDFRV